MKFIYSKKDGSYSVSIYDNINFSQLVDLKCQCEKHIWNKIILSETLEQPQGEICGQCGKLLSKHQYNAEYKCYTCTDSKL